MRQKTQSVTTFILISLTVGSASRHPAQVTHWCWSDRMRTREEWGWDEPRPCPPWCVVTDHLATRLSRKSDDYWHAGFKVHLDHKEFQGSTSRVTLRLSQRVKVDERGENTCRAEVAIECQGEFPPAFAREVVDTIITMAEAAEADTEWRMSMGFTVGPDLDTLPPQVGTEGDG